MTQELVKIWHDDHYCCDGDELVVFYNDYKQRKTKKAETNEELMQENSSLVHGGGLEEKN